MARVKQKIFEPEFELSKRTIADMARKGIGHSNMKNIKPDDSKPTEVKATNAKTKPKRKTTRKKK